MTRFEKIMMNKDNNGLEQQNFLFDMFFDDFDREQDEEDFEDYRHKTECFMDWIDGRMERMKTIDDMTEFLVLDCDCNKCKYEHDKTKCRQYKCGDDALSYRICSKGHKEWLSEEY